MTFKGTIRALVALSLLAALSGCAVADLAAHGIKEWEKRDQSGTQTASQPAPQSQTQSQPEEPPPPASAPQPRRSSVTVEELPAK
jgi:hypothetical protein